MTIMKVMDSHNRDLPCDVSEAVRNDAARDASAKIDRIRELEEEIAKHNAPKKKEIKELREESGKLAHVAATGQRVCPVKVEEVWDLQRYEKFVRRTDTMEVIVEPTALTEAERKKIAQMEIDYETDGDETTGASLGEGDASAAPPAEDSDKPGNAETEDAPEAPADDTGNAAPKGKKGKRGPRVKL